MAENAELATIRKQAQRYLEARYGKDYVYRAPETFENVLERWIWAVAAGTPELAEECMTQIEAHFTAAPSAATPAAGERET